MTLSDTVFIELRHAIIEGEYKPGQHLGEDELCNRFSVSRTPVREALKLLAKENIVEITPNSGARVVTLSQDDVTALYDMLIILEGAATRLAALKMTADQIKKLQELQYTMQRASGQNNMDLFYEVNLQFHWYITECSKSKYLIEIRGNIRRLVDRFARFAVFIPNQLSATMDEHPRIIDAIKRRNGELAEFVAREHMEHARDMLLEYLKDWKG
jgi:DNA-binding GntR family transcriptional regulator